MIYSHVYVPEIVTQELSEWKAFINEFLLTGDAKMNVKSPQFQI